MVYVFIVNPKSGKEQSVNKVFRELKEYLESKSVECYFFSSENPGDAVNLSRYSANKFKQVRIYACGGDGTLNEVLQGVVGFENVELGCVPIGTGNDFMRNFDKSFVMNFESQLSSPSRNIDLIYCQGDGFKRYAVNALSFGWESRVAINKNKFPVFSGSGAYIASVLFELVKKHTVEFRALIDEKSLESDDYIIGMCGNGAYYGGGFMGAPLSKLDDGLLDVVLAKNMTRRKVMMLFPKFRNGVHSDLNNKSFENLLTYNHAKVLEVRSTGIIPITIDGEAFSSSWLRCEVQHDAIKFIVPQKGLQRE